MGTPIYTAADLEREGRSAYAAALDVVTRHKTEDAVTILEAMLAGAQRRLAAAEAREAAIADEERCDVCQQTQSEHPRGEWCDAHAPRPL